MHGRGDGAPVGVRGGYTGRESPPSQARVASSSGTDCASDAGGGAAALITSCVAHVSVKRRRRCPGTVPPGRNARRRGFSLWKVPQIPKNFQRPGALPPDPRQHTLLCCAALARAKKKRTPSGDGMESVCHVWVFRAKREKFFEALFGVTLHHLNLDPASSPEALMPARSHSLSPWTPTANHKPSSRHGSCKVPLEQVGRSSRYRRPSWSAGPCGAQMGRAAISARHGPLCPL